MMTPNCKGSKFAVKNVKTLETSYIFFLHFSFILKIETKSHEYEKFANGNRKSFFVPHFFTPQHISRLFMSFCCFLIINGDGVFVLWDANAEDITIL